MPAKFADTQPTCLRSRRTLFWPTGPSTVGPLLQATRTVPIVFPFASDPVGPLRLQPGAAGRQRHRLR